MLKLLLFAVLVAHAQSEDWILKSNVDKVVVNVTTKVRLSCFSLNSKHNFTEPYVNISLITIQKETEGKKWENQVFLKYPNTRKPVIVNPNDNKKSDGNIDRRPMISDFLNYEWMVASDDSVGSFRCQAIGFNSMGQLIQKQSPTVTIGEIVPTLDGVVKYVADLREDIDKRLLDDEFGIHYWPTGRYHMMATKEGCPDTMNSIFMEGFVQVKSTSHGTSRNRAPMNFPDDTFVRKGENHTSNFHFCRSPAIFLGVGIWPQGSYCIQRQHSWEDSDCPTGFQPGNLTLYVASQTPLEVTNQTFYGMPFDIDPDQNRFQMWYCCRHDGSNARPIFLPSSKPFYLFRYGKACQKVLNMQEHETSILVQSDPSKGDFMNGKVPDSTLNPVEVQMCYYSKRPYH